MASCVAKPKIAKKEKQEKVMPAQVQSLNKTESNDNAGPRSSKKSCSVSPPPAKKPPFKKTATASSPQLPKTLFSAPKSPRATNLSSKKSNLLPRPPQSSKKPCSEAKSPSSTKVSSKKSALLLSLPQPSKNPCSAVKSPPANKFSSKKPASPACLATPQDQVPTPNMLQKNEHSPKLIRRFYEPLILLHTLGEVRGGAESSEPSRRSSSSALSSRDRRRQFLDALTFVCDYEKGGDTVAAIGLESTPQCHTFWIAANTCPKKKMVSFVQSLLENFKRMDFLQLGLDEGTTLVAKQCLRFGEKRIKATFQLLQKQIEKCRRLASRTDANDDRFDQVFIWLRHFQDRQLDESEIYKICFYAYENRKCTAMRSLESFSQEPTHYAGQDAAHLKWKQLRHLIGRLAHQFRASKHVVSHGSALLYLLDDCKVSGITPPKTSGAPRLVAGDKLLDGVLTRMLPKDAKDFPLLRKDLRFMDTNFQIGTRMLDQYQNSNFKPRVHAELQILEHFFLNGLNFEDSDRYIACSKPACYCCELYIRHHHGNFVVPDSHHKIWLNWRPPNVESQGKAQEKILNAMIADIRKEALHQIADRRQRNHWRPDSNTGITVSTWQDFSNQETGEDIGEE